jgi:hypothetical protein
VCWLKTRAAAVLAATREKGTGKVSLFLFFAYFGAFFKSFRAADMGGAFSVANHFHDVTCGKVRNNCG